MHTDLLFCAYRHLLYISEVIDWWIILGHVVVMNEKRVPGLIARDPLANNSRLACGDGSREGTQRVGSIVVQPCR